MMKEFALISYVAHSHGIIKAVSLKFTDLFAEYRIISKFFLPKALWRHTKILFMINGFITQRCNTHLTLCV